MCLSNVCLTALTQGPRIPTAALHNVTNQMYEAIHHRIFKYLLSGAWLSDRGNDCPQNCYLLLVLEIVAACTVVINDSTSKVNCFSCCQRDDRTQLFIYVCCKVQPHIYI